MSERIWAVIDNGVISNTFVGDDAFAELVRPDHDEVIEVTDLEPRPGVQWTVHPDGYRPPSPFPSWVWNNADWEPPVPRPSDSGAWLWNEDSQTWIDTTPPTE